MPKINPSRILGLFVVLDKQISVRVPRIERQGLPSDNVVLLTQNGIEYFYPPELVAEAFCCTAEDGVKWNFENEPIEFNGIRKTKKELAQYIANALKDAHQLHPEIRGLVSQIQAACK